MQTGLKIKERREQIGVSAVALAKILNVHHSTIYRYEKGDIEKVPTNILEDIAKALNTTPAYLMGWEKAPSTQSSPLDQLTPARKEKAVTYIADLLREQEEETSVEEPQELYSVDAVSRLCAGYGYSYDDFDVERYYVEEEPPAYDLASRVKGDSMLPAYEDGEIVYLVDTGITHFSGQVCAVVVNDQTYIKKVYTKPDGLLLVPINPDYPEDFIDFPPMDDDTHIKIFKVVGSALPVDK